MKRMDTYRGRLLGLLAPALLTVACENPNAPAACDGPAAPAPIELRVSLPDSVRVALAVLPVRGEASAEGGIDRITLRVGDGPEREVTLDPTSPAGAFADSVPLAPGVNAVSVRAYAKGCVASVSIVAERHGYSVVFLGTLGGAESRAEDVDDHGRVVGSSLTPNGETRAFLWREGRMTALDTLEVPRVVSSYWPATITRRAAHAINRLGEIVGTDGIHAVAWREGRVRNLGVSAYSGSFGGLRYAAAYDINDAGTIVGGWEVADSCSACRSGSFVIESGQVTTIEESTVRSSNIARAINSSGQIVGQSARYLHTDAFLFTGGALRPLAGAVATDVNDRGQVVGYGREGPPWVYTIESGQLTPLPVPCPSGTCRADPQAINRSGHIAGGVFLWQHGGAVNLSELTGVRGLNARAINDRGQIAGSGVNPATGKEEALLLNPAG